jgi:hypothetical protein
MIAMAGVNAAGRRALALALAGLAASVALAGPARASHGDDGVRTSGRCGAVHWHLKAKHDDGRIEVEAEIDSNHGAQQWHWKLKHNGSVSAKGTKRTGGRSGSFEVERRMSDLSGRDHFVLRATHAGTTCRGTISA